MTINLAVGIGSEILKWVLIAINTGLIMQNVLIGIKSRKLNKESRKNLQDVEKLMEHTKKQALAVNHIYEQETNYCIKCKKMLDLKK